jgi:RHS repeat-associated protein
MALLRVLRSHVGRNGTGSRARRQLAGRRMMAAVMGPVLAGWLLMPATVTAGTVAGIAVLAAKAAPAKAATGPSVAVVLVNGETAAPETAVLEAAGYTVTPVTPAALAAMSETTFHGYAAVVIGDSSTSSSCSTTAPSTSSLGTNWEPWVNGNVALLGTAPAMPGTAGANSLITDAVGYAAAQPSSGSVTGLYVSLNCGYSTASAGTAVSLLANVDGIGTAGGLTVNGNLACSDAGTVNTWEADAASTFGGFAATSLGTGSTGFPSPSCPVREAFDSWPAMFTPVAYDAGSDVTDNFTASDGVTGQPYILLGTPPLTTSTGDDTLLLAPSQGGEVPIGATSGGTNNGAAQGIALPSAGDPVNTEDGDFSQTAADASIPTFGPALDFTRTYDAGVAEQQTESGTPGSMGYGWTDNWASSAASDRPSAGNLYLIDGLATDNGMGGPAADAAIGAAADVLQSSGNIYIADELGNRVEEVAGANQTQWGITMTKGDVYTIAGSPTGVAGDSPNGTSAAKSLLDAPSGVAVDNEGNVFIADSGNNRVVELVASASTAWGNMSSPVASDIYTVAGSASGAAGTGKDAEPATSSDLDDPNSVFIGGNAGSNLYIADSGNNRIQMVTPSAQTKWGENMATAWDVYTIAGSSAGTGGLGADGELATTSDLNDPQDAVIDTDGDMLIADTDNCRVQEVAKNTGAEWGNSSSFTANDMYTVAGSSAGTCGTGADNKKATSSDLDYPVGVASFGTIGSVYIADNGNNRIQMLAASTGTDYGQSVTEGDVYTVAGSASGTEGDSGNGGAATSALLNGPELFSNDDGGGLYLSDTGNDEAREVTAGSPSDITDLAGNGFDLGDAGDGGVATGAALANPDGVTADSDGNLYIADAGNNRVQEIAASTHAQFGISMTAGDTYTIAGSATGYSGDSGNGVVATDALLDVPTSVAVDAGGDVYICDSDNNRIVEVAATSHTQYGIKMTAGDTYTVAGSAAGDGGYTGDGGPAASALLTLPSGIAVDKAGDLFIADTVNSRIQEVPATTGTQYGISMTAGDMYTIAGNSSGNYGSSGDGGPGTSALLSDPFGVAVDSAGNVYIADSVNNRIQEVAAAAHTQYKQSMKVGYIYTVAGSSSGASGDSGDGGPAASGLLDDPADIATDGAGDLYIADSENNQVREVAAGSGTQWAQQMTAADIYTIAGSTAGTEGTSVTGGPVGSALLDFPIDVGSDASGDVFIPDLDSSSILEATATSSPAFPVYPIGGNITITQPGGAQVTFYPEVSDACPSPEVGAGEYCVLPAFQGATLTSSTANDTYTFSPTPVAGSYTYSWDGQLISQTDAAGNTLTITYDSPAPGSAVSGDSSEVCPSGATSCETILSASGRSLVLGSNASGFVTSVVDPMGRQWTYAYNSADQLTSATDPAGNVTSYTYGKGSNGPLQANDLLTITGPNAQPGGPDAGDSTVNVYNSANQITAQTDPMGYTTTFNYCVNASAGDCMNPATGDGDVTVTDAEGNATVYNYDQGVATAITSWSGNTASENDYGPSTTAQGTSSGGTLLDAWEANPDGDITRFTYDQYGNITSETDPLGNVSTTWSMPSGAVTCAADATTSSPCSKSEQGPAQVPPGSTISPPSTAPPAGVNYVLYDTSGNSLYSTVGVYPPGSSTASATLTNYTLYKGDSVTLNGTAVSCDNTPPAPNLPCAYIDETGTVTQVAYDQQGDLTSVSTPDGNGSEVATTTFAYNADGQETSTTSPEGNLPDANAANYTTTTSYTANGLVASVTQAGDSGATVSPRTTSYSYDADGNQITTTDARGYTTSTTYNANDEPTLVTNADGDSTLTCYDSNADVAEVVPPAGVAANSLTPASCPDSYPSGYGDRLATDATTYTYNSTGNQTSMTTPAPAGQSGYETTTYTYDAAGQQVLESDPPDSDGSNAPDQLTQTTYNADGQVATQTTGYDSSEASTVSYCYDPNGDITAVVAPDGNISGAAPCNTNPSYPWTVDPKAYPTQAAFQTTYTYDSAGDESTITTPPTTAAPDGATTTQTYNSFGELATSTDPNGITTTDSYNPEGSLTGISYSGGSAHAVSYSYDAAGDITGMTDGTGSSSYIYDPFGELTSTTDGAGQTVTYGYNADGEVASIGYPLPATATWATSDNVTYGYDHADQLTSVTDFNGDQTSITNTADGLPTTVALGSSGDVIDTAYDATDNPSAITVKNGSTTLLGFSYQDAPSGDVLSETDTPDASQSPTYTYDAQGRISSMTIGDGSPISYGFDASGNLASLPNGATPTYDDAGELVSAVLSGTTTSYTYDADGNQLTAKQGSSTISSGSWNGADQLTAFSDPEAAMTSAAYDGNGLRQSETVNGTTENFTWGSGTNLLMDSQNAYIYDGGAAPFEQVNLATGAVSYLAADALGSVRGVISGSGSLTASTSYDAWGNPLTPAGLTSYTPFGYAGSYTDPTGLLYLVNRYYDPSTGQFLSVDPDVAQTGEPYGYAGGDPVSNTDPLGLSWMIGLPWNQNPNTSESQFRNDLAPILGYPDTAKKEYQVDFGYEPYRNRRIDLYQTAFGWLNELKVGKQSYVKTGLNVTSNYSEVSRDKYILSLGPVPPIELACHPSAGGVCKPFTAKGATWWFRYNNKSACQRSISPVDVCPTLGLILALLDKHTDSPGINVILLIETNRYEKEWSHIYATQRKALQKAFQSNNCPVQELINLQFEPYWKWTTLGNDNSCAHE